MKKQKIEDIKNVHEFYQVLIKECVDKNYEELFGSGEPFTKADMFAFARCAVYTAYNHIRNKYVKQERKKYDKIIGDYDTRLGVYQEQVGTLKAVVKVMEEEIKSFVEFLTWGKENFQQYADKATIDCINQEIKYVNKFIADLELTKNVTQGGENAK